MVLSTTMALSKVIMKLTSVEYVNIIFLNINSERKIMFGSFNEELHNVGSIPLFENHGD